VTVTLVAIPVIKDARKFHLEKGRRWTVVEHLLLEALARQDWSITNLTTASALPRRVVIEVIIRLMRAGWIEVKIRSAEIVFSSTPTGRIYAMREDLPPVIRATARYVGYLVELHSGAVFRSREFVTLTHDQWKQRRTGRAWAEVTGRLKENQAFPDIQVLADRLLASDEQLTRVDVQDWRPRRLMAMVTVRDGEIEGAEGDIPEQLRAAILIAAKTATKSGVAVSAPPYVLERSLGIRPPTIHPIAFQTDDLIAGGSAHKRAMKTALDRARHRIVMHSTFMSSERAQATLELLRQPVQRGVVVDILWGQSTIQGGVNKTRQAALEFRELLTREGLQDRIRVHATSTRSHAKIILSDLGKPDQFQALVGSCNWLSSDFGSFDVSLRLQDSGIVRDLALDLAEMARPRDGQIADFSVEMLRLGNTLKPATRRSASQGTARIVTTQEHAALLVDARDQALERVVLLSHRLDVAAKPAISAIGAAAQMGGPRTLEAHYSRVGDNISQPDVNALEAWASQRGVRLKQSPIKLHAKVLAWDTDNLLVTSLNLLSADPKDSDPRQELGVFVKAPNAARSMISTFTEACTGTQQEGTDDNV
tara:strand:+ start:24772 stop:26553 length:1782 start_codon:yes stop_codon:yes gene_type:complete